MTGSPCIDARLTNNIADGASGVVEVDIGALGTGVGMSLLTAAFIALAAYLGGRLVYENAVGVHSEG